MTIRQTKPRKSKPIPPPPRAEAGYDAIIDYLHKYSTEELEAAGYLEEASRDEAKEPEASATFALLQMNGLRLKLTRKECEKLVELAMLADVAVETLAKKWIRANLRAAREHQAMERVCGTDMPPGRGVKPWTTRILTSISGPCRNPNCS